MTCPIDAQPLAPKATTLYEQLGGRTGLRRVVQALYFHTFRDPRVAHLFQGVDSQRLLKHQEDFLAVALGGPQRYRGRSLADAHGGLVRDLGLNAGHIEVLCELLAKTLYDFDVHPRPIRQAVERIRAFGPLVLGDHG